ncbi:MAG: DUF3368 domain-containing protein [Armatimonadetes bacterium]|nr:DUF3368 domain-containing protein [Armatimonadota bacterium]
MIVVADTSPLVALATIGHLDLLRELFGEVAIPRAVYDEVVIAGAGQPGSAEVQAACWIVVHPDPARPGCFGLHAGEEQAIALALRLRAQFVVLDERPGRRAAVEQGLVVTGTVGVLVRARLRGLLAELRPELDRLLAGGALWIAQSVYDKALQQAGE